MSEEWRDIPEWEGFYQASDLGRIRSVDRPVLTRWGQRVRPGRDMVQHLTRAPGYACVKLSRDGRGVELLVHRLVALAFHGPCPDWAELCRHLDDDGLHNTPDNLAWGTRGENVADMVRLSGHYMTIRTHCKNGHEFTPENTARRTTNENSSRSCRTCARDKSRRQRRATTERQAA